MIDFDCVEIDVAAEHAPPDTGFLEPIQQRERERVFLEVLRLEPEFPNKFEGTARTLPPGMFGNAAKVLSGLLEKRTFTSRRSRQLYCIAI